MSVQGIGATSAAGLRFGPFELNFSERSLKKANRIVPLGGRAYDILIALLENAGEVVTRAELIEKAWPEVTVEEVSLRVHLSALRKALDDGQFGNKYIARVQGRGYSFIAPVVRFPADNDESEISSGFPDLPPALGRMIGRDNFVLEVQATLQSERLVTILGAGGMGKTTVALAVGHSTLLQFAGAVFFVDLSTVKDKDQAICAVASAVGLAPQLANPKKTLLDFLRSRRALIILDSCEHLIEKAAEIACDIFMGAPDVQILATSREMLLVAGECILYLPPLECPPKHQRSTASELLAYPAGRLFVERISARDGHFSLSDGEAPIVAEICRKLNGIALAIELAAGRAANFGIRNTLANLGSGLDILKFGRRTANPRHQSLRATLEWSYHHLSEIERVVLRRVAIFVRHFSPAAALAVAGETGIDRSEIESGLENLVNKSLIVAWPGYRGMLYRLLDTTRSYALEKLAESGEHHSIAMRHASYLGQSLENNRDSLFNLEHGRSPADATQHYLADIRAALEWSVSPNGKAAAAI